MESLWQFFLRCLEVRHHDRKARELAAILAGPHSQKRDDSQAWSAQYLYIGSAGPSLRSQAFTRTSVMKAHALNSLARVAVACTEYQRVKKEYPKRLDALVPEYLPRIPVDPFSGEPLYMKSVGNGMVLCSVGEDCSATIRVPSNPSDDICFCLGEAYIKHHTVRAVPPPRER